MLPLPPGNERAENSKETKQRAGSLVKKLPNDTPPDAQRYLDRLPQRRKQLTGHTKILMRFALAIRYLRPPRANPDHVDGSATRVYTHCMISDAELLTTLRRYWGYDSFRPLQHRIVRTLLENRDTCVIMPTGGGSRCATNFRSDASGENCNRHFSADCADARPGRAAISNGNRRGRSQ